MLVLKYKRHIGSAHFIWSSHLQIPSKRASVDSTNLQELLLFVCALQHGLTFINIPVTGTCDKFDDFYIQCVNGYCNIHVPHIEQKKISDALTCNTYLELL